MIIQEATAYINSRRGTPSTPLLRVNRLASFRGKHKSQARLDTTDMEDDEESGTEDNNNIDTDTGLHVDEVDKHLEAKRKKKD